MSEKLSKKNVAGDSCDDGPGLTSVGQDALPEVRFTSHNSHMPSSVGKKAKSTCQLNLNGVPMPGSASAPEPATTGRTPNKGKTPVKEAAGPPPENGATGSDTKSHSEVRSSGSKGRKGRMVPSRYKNSSQLRGAAAPVKGMPDSSCLSMNQSQLFSTATSSTPNSSKLAGDVKEVSATKRKPPPKMAALRPSDKEDSGKQVPKMKKALKATVKVKPIRVADQDVKAKKVGGGGDRLSEHEILYNHYLQWEYMCRMSEFAIRRDQPDMSMQARQLSQLVEGARQQVLELERKLQAVTVYDESAALERDLSQILCAVNSAADTVRGDLSRLTTCLDATRNHLQLKGFAKPAHVAHFIDDLTSAAERCRDGIGGLVDATAPNANLLQHTADSVCTLDQATQDIAQHLTQCETLVEQLSSLALQEASLSIGSSLQTAQLETPHSGGDRPKF